MNTSRVTLALFFAVVVGTGCGSGVSETGQQIGDVMASIDESGGSGGGFALLDASRRTYARLAPPELHGGGWASFLLPAAEATSCALASTFSSCASNVITRTFDGCTVGGATFNGTVTLTFADATVDNTCLPAAVGHSITRVPNFTVTGRRGATLEVTKTASAGQVITVVNGTTFTFTNDGIRRVFTTGSGTSLFDFTTKTTSGITVTGVARAGRTLSGGTLRVTNNLTGVSCDYSPTNVSWTSTCNCPTSGSWSGSCSDGKTTSLNITGCGAASITVGSETDSVTFDRCYGT
jgi:hypothetical protein